ncbi:phosphoribosylglycinamide formyltransferase [Microbacterium sp. cf332]|uniref:phosphoribosylglycinamide formyltransferase n=1 Tax=Microbacterium sp. cf332 TaxID=1761804 RepID=UPI0008921614|nr:phosphoribosylglycinamide formyltransferase [Microbacterium sp. cf332]SDQ76413.1 phosphoribosylglycinamide formyltransferase-1 [Microbacterium sp. cf332]
MLTVAVLISGGGSNLRALLDAAAEPGFPARVVVVGADRPADGLAHADAYNIPTFAVPFREYASREEWGAELARQLAAWAPDLIVLSGLMRLLPAAVVDAWAPRIINTHPAYLPEFPGAHGVRDALAADAVQTGASVIVVDAGVDTGPILAQERVPVLPGDDEDALHDRIKPVERRLLIDVVRRIASGELDLAAPTAPEPPTPSVPAA